MPPGITKELRASRFYRDIKEEAMEEAMEEAIEEGRQKGMAIVFMKAVPMLLEVGLSVEDIADQLNLTTDQVHEFAQQQP
jgi:predicted transposase/invertase (TIGR01784 family)